MPDVIGRRAVTAKRVNPRAEQSAVPEVITARECDERAVHSSLLL